MPETMKLPLRIKHYDTKLKNNVKISVFLGGEGGTCTSQYFVEKIRKSFSKIKILSRGQLLYLFQFQN